MRVAEVGRNTTEQLESLQQRLAAFEERAKTPISADELRSELAALKTTLGMGSDAVGTVGSAAAKEIATESLPGAVPPTTFDPEAIASVLIAKTHDAATAVEVLEAKGATVEGSPTGPVIRTRSGEVLAFEEGIARILPPGLLKPVGAAGSGGKGGSARPDAGTRPPPGSMLQRFADSGNDPNFYRANRDAILRERYGRAPMTRLK